MIHGINWQSRPRHEPGKMCAVSDLKLVLLCHFVNLRTPHFYTQINLTHLILFHCGGMTANCA